MLDTFGAKNTGTRLQKIRQSSNYIDGSFQNIEPTQISPSNVSWFNIFKSMFFKPASVKPKGTLPNIKTDIKSLAKPHFWVVWFGHSSYFIQVNGFKVLVDPVLSGNASPFTFFGKAFDGSDNYTSEDLPEIDLLIITHDHYDHLDYPTIKKLSHKTSQVVTTLGVGAHLEKWGVKSDIISELNWWEQKTLSEEVKITATPTRHFSGRSLKRNQTLWASFVLELFDKKIFVGSDSGFSKSFKTIGAQFGPFDLAFMECGQYSVNWPQIHMFPEEMVKAARQIRAKTVIPVHWGKFVLSHHLWNEPVERYLKAAENAPFQTLIPKIGEPVNLSLEYNQEPWWLFENNKTAYEREATTLE